MPYVTNWSDFPDMEQRLLELNEEGLTHQQIADVLVQEYPDYFPADMSPTRDAIKNAVLRTKRKYLTSEDAPNFIVPDNNFIGLTIGYFDIETTFSTQPIMLYGAIADAWGNIQQFHKGPDITNDRDLVDSYARALEGYDILVSWNGKMFDVPVISGRLAYHGLRPLFRGMHIDAMYYASGNAMRIGRRSLQSVSEYFNSQNRKSPLSVKIWDAAMAGSEDAYREIQEHCDADVLVLREVFGTLKSQVLNIHR
jgi:uncharacterized protein YprB with RNaseH-like and TPR domain